MKIHITFFLTCFKQLLIEDVAFWIPILNSSVPLLILKIFLNAYDFCIKFGNILLFTCFLYDKSQEHVQTFPFETKHLLATRVLWDKKDVFYPNLSKWPKHLPVHCHCHKASNEFYIATLNSSENWMKKRL